MTPSIVLMRESHRGCILLDTMLHLRGAWTFRRSGRRRTWLRLCHDLVCPSSLR